MDSFFIIGKDQIPSRFNLEAGECLRMTLVALPGCSTSMDIEFDLTGPGASLDLAGLYICNSDELFNLKVIVRHVNGGCVSRQLFKGIVGGRSRTSFHGLIYVPKDSQKTKAFQESHTILIDDSAVAEARPQLEIYADDVECSHGATTGYLDQDQLYYMRSRGIPESDAKHLQMISFLSPVLERLPQNIQDDILSQCQA